MERYLINGKEIFDNICSSSGDYPVMLPRAPEQTYIDRYPEEDKPGSNFKQQRQQQSDYAAEVKVYRALENLEEKGLIVLHNFEFTHHQFCLCDKSHVRDKKKCKGCKNPSNREGECDFLVLSPEFCVIIEVKNMSHVEFKSSDPGTKVEMEKQSQALIGTFRKSAEQRDKIATLIKCIDINTTILQFTSYPNFSKQFKEQFQCSQNMDLHLYDTELSTIIYQEDLSGFHSDSNSLESFGTWWKCNVTHTISCIRKRTEEPENKGNSHEKVKNMLLAIWATEKTKCDQSRCSLGRCIMDTDKLLLEAQITLQLKEGKKRDRNPGVLQAPEVIRDYMAVQNLTLEQSLVFESEESLLWINGPAGAGKTVLLCGKMLQLAQSDKENKIVLLRFTGKGNNSELYQRALDKANVQYEEMIAVTIYESEAASYSQLGELISDKESQVIIVNIIDYKGNFGLITALFSSIKSCYLFIDDIQLLLYYSSVEDCGQVIDKLLDLSSSRSVWIAGDLAQGYYYEDAHIVNLVDVIGDKLHPSQRTTLSMNLRNTFDLSNILSVIREKFIGSIANRPEIFRMVLPTQIPGHFIHGPKTVIHILDKFNADMLNYVLNTELDKIFRVKNEFFNSDIGLVYNYVISDIESIIEETVKKRRDDAGNEIGVCHSEHSSSSEWPAVVVLHEMTRYSERDLTTLYLAISRARVHCSVILYPLEGTCLEDNRQMMIDLPDRLKSYAQIIRHNN